MEYRAEATSLTGFVQQIVAYIRSGYFIYVMGFVRDGKDPAAVDEKLIEKYGIARSKWQRSRRKAEGYANLQYIRFERTWLLMATKGRHEFFELEAKNLRNAKRTPIRIGGYSISFRRGGTDSGKYHVHVRIDGERYKELKAHFLDLAVHRRAEKLVSEFWALPFEPYAPVRRQLLNVLRSVNRKRKEAAFETIGFDALRFKRRVVKPFEECKQREKSL